LEIETVAGRHIGWVNSYWVDKNSCWRDCGINIAEDDLWGQGLGREAFALWVDYLFGTWDLPRLGMGTWGGNVRMMHLAARVGMHEEAHFADARIVEGKRYDAVRWGMTRSQWERYHVPSCDGLRLFTPADWDAVVELTCQLFSYHRVLQGESPLSTPDARDTVFDWLKRRDTVLWVWQEADDVVGLARARHSGVYFLEEFVIKESCRGRGIGARFLKALEDELRATGERDLFLSMVWPGNPGAIDFYRSQGYDLLNSFELRKGLDQNRRGRRVSFLGRHFYLCDSVPDFPESQ
jgi:RimJ/RimL family protein N-acetyltransferase